MLLYMKDLDCKSFMNSGKKIMSLEKNSKYTILIDYMKCFNAFLFCQPSQSLHDAHLFHKTVEMNTNA